jgi:hypothetical protein
MIKKAYICALVTLSVFNFHCENIGENEIVPNGSISGTLNQTGANTVTLRLLLTECSTPIGCTVFEAAADYSFGVGTFSYSIPEIDPGTYNLFAIGYQANGTTMTCFQQKLNVIVNPDLDTPNLNFAAIP